MREKGFHVDLQLFTYVVYFCLRINLVSHRMLQTQMDEQYNYRLPRAHKPKTAGDVGRII